ncbi:uncharacterized protein BXZ73DRAFT_84890 [Epithele typhae]|uniref:uncharacterized protein n=1 Tax=Epithele typhae TaxID=378194 RepID=UPI002007C9D2|nr:uncharacterized protein BXZ73DRAFT_84890 [Epithele typhae]KAH9906109.1 hypothetical protein BXZ73DRAFT_84890 [Epithele typhae]
MLQCPLPDNVSDILTICMDFIQPKGRAIVVSSVLDCKMARTRFSRLRELLRELDAPSLHCAHALYDERLVIGICQDWVHDNLRTSDLVGPQSVHAESKGALLHMVFADAGDKLELVVVEDITVPGAFDDAVLHTASPFHFHADDLAKLITPAVAGMTGILASAAAHAGLHLQRVVVMRPCAASAHPGRCLRTRVRRDGLERGEVEAVGCAVEKYILVGSTASPIKS